ncbi:hypothetical protein SPF06_11200 [Sinomonas sp. JGH33]|uniref:DUF1648 domain-containing protein n=1 Tax=Sinomonas terricola TaxID=3110330 RepID=A0ABU5T877_9MICC|nr:hypothetical protein [Sinomonas sp. JGH33]MEA5455286.1 hypothetical protein [Sinomonas sp. JGH33]
MGEREGRWDRKAVRFAVGFPILLAAGFVIAAITFRGQVPEPVAWFWDADGGRAFVPFAGYLTGGALVVALVGIALCLQAGIQARPVVSRKIFMAGGVGMSMFLVTVLAAGLMGQVGAKDARLTHPDPIVLASGSGATVAFSIVMFMSFKPEERWSPRDEQALLEVLEPERVRDTFVFWAHARSSVFVMLAVVGSQLSLLALLLSAWLSLAIFLVSLVAASMLILRVSVSPDKVTLAFMGLVRVGRIRTADVLRAGYGAVVARAYGGWGYRHRGKVVSALVSSGEAVDVLCRDGSRFVFSAKDPAIAEHVADVLGGAPAK